MEISTLDEPHQATLDVLYAEAKQVISQSANQLKTLTERLRQTHTTDTQRWRAAAAGGQRAPELAALRSLLDRELDRLRGFIHQLRSVVRLTLEPWNRSQRR